MRVLVVTNMYPTPAEPWFGSFVHEQVQGLRAVGTDVRVLSFDGRARRRAYLTAVRSVRSAAASADIVHAHYGLSGMVALVARAGKPIVTTFWGSDLGYVRWQRHVSRVVARLTEPVFASKEGAIRFGYPSAAVVPSSVDLNLFRVIGRREARSVLGWPVDRPIALFPSSPTNPVKCVDLFNAAIAEARHVVPDLKAVYLEGFTREETALVMNAVDVVVLTSKSEGSPTVVREALACATPVVGVTVGDVDETLSGLPGCAVVARDPNVLAKSVAAAVRAGRAPELRERAAAYGRERVAARLIAVYADTLSKPRSRARRFHRRPSTR